MKETKTKANSASVAEYLANRASAKKKHRAGRYCDHLSALANRLRGLCGVV